MLLLLLLPAVMQISRTLHPRPHHNALVPSSLHLNALFYTFIACSVYPALSIILIWCCRCYAVEPCPAIPVARAFQNRSSGDSASVSDCYPPTSPCLCRAYHKYSHLFCRLPFSFLLPSSPSCRPWPPRQSSSPRSKPAASSLLQRGLSVNKFEKVCVDFPPQSLARLAF
jgi:hypothetical protein